MLITLKLINDEPNLYKLREERHREQLWNAIKDGVVQMVVSGEFFSLSLTNVDMMYPFCQNPEYFGLRTSCVASLASLSDGVGRAKLKMYYPRLYP